MLLTLSPVRTELNNFDLSLGTLGFLLRMKETLACSGQFEIFYKVILTLNYHLI